MQRDCPPEEYVPPRNVGELLLLLGDRASLLLRDGNGLGEIASELGVGFRTCLLAVEFLGAPDVIKFRAMVEDWNALEIRSRLEAWRSAQATLAH